MTYLEFYNALSIETRHKVKILCDVQQIEDDPLATRDSYPSEGNSEYYLSKTTLSRHKNNYLVTRIHLDTVEDSLCFRLEIINKALVKPKKEENLSFADCALKKFFGG